MLMKAKRNLETKSCRRQINAGALPLGDNSTKMDRLSAASYLGVIAAFQICQGNLLPRLITSICRPTHYGSHQ